MLMMTPTLTDESRTGVFIRSVGAKLAGISSTMIVLSTEFC